MNFGKHLERSKPTRAIFERANNEMTNTMRNHIRVYEEYKEEQVEEEFAKEIDFTQGKRKNWREKCYRHFRIWLLYSKLIVSKEGLLIFI